MNDQRFNNSKLPDKATALSPAQTIKCCGPGVTDTSYLSPDSWTVGKIATPVGGVPRVATRLLWSDRLGHWKVRWGIGRKSFAIRPGLYAVGNPTNASDVFVTANYKQSFDSLRASLDGRDGWILVLDTKGINVWCAAGKGTFGTDELIHRLRDTRLSEIISHWRLIVPQLGAPGVAAQAIRKETRFVVRYGPIRATDVPEYLDRGRKATSEMRMVRFGIADRAALVPVEVIGYGKFALAATVVLALLSGFGENIYSIDRVWSFGLRALAPLLAGTIGGALMVPLMLPWLPGKSFSAKGIWAGLIAWSLFGFISVVIPNLAPGWAGFSAGLLLTLALASFVGMNFTGSSTYTSLSGVRKEMRRWVPIQAVTALVGVGLWITARFI